ncbi:DUF6053 domain-containing protein [Lysobacter enzymogenes]|uniref:DUF6053 domain-containing protein n=1 Tax=Lysobacter enzymogenes TaxID=69 RepID=UPI003394D371
MGGASAPTLFDQTAATRHKSAGLKPLPQKPNRCPKPSRGTGSPHAHRNAYAAAITPPAARTSTSPPPRARRPA